MWWKNIDLDKVFIGLLFIIIIGLSIYTHTLTNHTEEVITKFEQNDSLNGKYTQIYYDQEIATLKKINKDLYDSLESQKDKIEFLTQFNYKKKYVFDTVKVEEVHHKVINDTNFVEIKQDSIEAPIQEYAFANEPNDTIQYELKIGSTVQPKWYLLNVEVSDKFTIVNKDLGNGMSETNIESANNGQIQNVTAFNKKESKSIWKRIAFGPSVTVGFSPITKRCDLLIGVSATWDLFEK